jgi:hypothetical protein
MEYIQEEVLHELTLEPQDSLTLVDYLRDRREAFLDVGTRYFVLGSYDSPFKQRLDIVETELNRRYKSYAYLLAPQPGIGLEADLPELSIKFYAHALYADYITLVLEHNAGGALVEAGRCDQPRLKEKTWVFPRGHGHPYLTTFLNGRAPQSRDECYAIAIEMAYHADNLDSRLDDLAVRAQDGQDIPVTQSELKSYIDDELDERQPDYTGVLTDDLTYYEQVTRCLPWTTEEELRDRVSEIP